MAEKIKKTKGGAIKGFIAVGVIAIFFLIIGGIIEFVKTKTATTTTTTITRKETTPQIRINREEIWNDYKTGNLKTMEEYGLKSEEQWQAIIDAEMEREDREILKRYPGLLETVGKDEAYKIIEEEFGIDNLDLDLVLAGEEERIRAERREMVEAAFSAWDGAHIGLAAFIKENMNNPKSYDHVKTTFRDDGDYITVQTTFRGTNAFNAIVPTTITAKCSLDGQVLEIIGQD